MNYPYRMSTSVKPDYIKYNLSNTKAKALIFSSEYLNGNLDIKLNHVTLILFHLSLRVLVT